MLVITVELDLLGQLPDLAIDPGPGKTLFGQVGEQALVLALPPPDHRCENLKPGALGQLQDAVDDLLGGLTLDRSPVVGAVGDADPGIEETQVVVHLGDRPHGRPGVAGGGLLVDRDRRRQPVDEVDVGLVHLPQELAGVGGQRFDIAALPLGIDGVEGQRRLARPGETGEDDELVAGQLDREVLQVVLTGAPDENRVGGHAPPW